MSAQGKKNETERFCRKCTFQISIKLIRSIQCHSGLDDQQSLRYVAFLNFTPTLCNILLSLSYFSLITRLLCIKLDTREEHDNASTPSNSNKFLNAKVFGDHNFARACIPVLATYHSYLVELHLLIHSFSGLKK